MHPTPEETLRAALRMIASASDGTEPDEAANRLDDASRLLRRLERSGAARLPFLVTDNAWAVDLLEELSPLLPTLAEEIAATAEQTAADEPSLHAMNKQFQNLLGRAVHLLPDDPAGEIGRQKIADHARARIAADPTLHREPTPRAAPPSLSTKNSSSNPIGVPQ